MFKLLKRLNPLSWFRRTEWLIERYTVGGTSIDWMAAVQLISSDGRRRKNVVSAKYPSSFHNKPQAITWAHAQGKIIPGVTVREICHGDNAQTSEVSVIEM